MKEKNYLLVISFIIIIFIVPIAGFVKPDDEFSKIENRNLQGFPVFHEGSIEGFIDDFEDYAVDQFPGRNIVIKLYTKMQLVLKKTDVGNTIVVDDWLFIRDYNIDQNRLNELVGSLRGLVKESPASDFHYMIFPNKIAMLADLHPKHLDGSISQNNSQLLNRTLNDIEGLNVVNISDILLEDYSPKEREKFYYKTDFHWNAKGAFNAFELMMDGIGGYDVVKPANDKLKRVKHDNKYFKGDLEGRFSGNIKNNDIGDSYQIIDTENLIYYTSIDDKQEVRRDEIIGENLHKSVIGYNDIFTSNLSCIRIVNKNPIINKKALILKDSFFNAMVDPITTVFSEVIIIDPRYYVEDYSYNEIMKEKAPDYVLFCYHQSNLDEDLIRFLKD